jgi:hypothetical protein
MRLSLPKLQEMPSVHTALAWLLPDHADGEILQAARATGLVLADDGPHWKADGDTVMRMAEDNLTRLPDDPDRLGEIMHGLGEIAARSHVPSLADLLVDHLKAKRAQISLQKLFDAAVACDRAIPHEIGVDDLALAQWLSRATLDWNTFNAALVRIGHPDRVFGHFGLGFVVRIVFRVDPSVIDDWIGAHLDHPTVAVIGSTARNMVFPFDGKASTSALLESKTVAIKCLAAASLVCPIDRQPPSSLSDCHKSLMAAGFAPSDATWMTGMRIKNAIHARYWNEHAHEQANARLGYVEEDPERAMGGLRNAEAEKNMLRNQLDHAEKTYAELLPALEDMLSDMAKEWPADGLSEEQMRSLEPIFVDTAEIRHRLAAKLAHRANRDWLLKRNIDRLRDFIGLAKTPDAVPREYFLPDERRFAAIADWTAPSLVLLYDGNNRGAGPRTSDLVSSTAKAAGKLMAQPFIPVRQSGPWQSVMTRAACAGRFAFAVVSSTPEAQRASVERLNELALEHAFKILSARNLPTESADTFHRLSIQAVRHMELTTKPDEVREKWGLTKDLPDFARALALWSSPKLAEKHKALACDLFQRVCVAPLSRGSYNLQMSRMATLLDTAIASSFQANKSDLIACIKEIWKSGYREWLPITDRLENIAEKLALAVDHDGTERAEIIADEVFATSYCRQLIDASAKQDQKPTTHAN